MSDVLLANWVVRTEREAQARVQAQEERLLDDVRRDADELNRVTLSPVRRQSWRDWWPSLRRKRALVRGL